MAATDKIDCPTERHPSNNLPLLHEVNIVVRRVGVIAVEYTDL